MPDNKYKYVVTTGAPRTAKTRETLKYIKDDLEYVKKWVPPEKKYSRVLYVVRVVGDVDKEEGAMFETFKSMLDMGLGKYRIKMIAGRKKFCLKFYQATSHEKHILNVCSTCWLYKRKLDSRQKRMLEKVPHLTIREAILFGNTHLLCPHYVAWKHQSDIVLITYTMIRSLIQSNGFKEFLKNYVRDAHVVFDEARHIPELATIIDETISTFKKDEKFDPNEFLAKYLDVDEKERPTLLTKLRKRLSASKKEEVIGLLRRIIHKRIISQENILKSFEVVETPWSIELKLRVWKVRDDGFLDTKLDVISGMAEKVSLIDATPYWESLNGYWLGCGPHDVKWAISDYKDAWEELSEEEWAEEKGESQKGFVPYEEIERKQREGFIIPIVYEDVTKYKSLTKGKNLERHAELIKKLKEALKSQNRTMTIFARDQEERHKLNKWYNVGCDSYCGSIESEGIQLKNHYTILTGSPRINPNADKGLEDIIWKSVKQKYPNIGKEEAFRHYQLVKTCQIMIQTAFRDLDERKDVNGIILLGNKIDGKEGKTHLEFAKNYWDYLKAPYFKYFKIPRKLRVDDKVDWIVHCLLHHEEPEKLKTKRDIDTAILGFVRKNPGPTFKEIRDALTYGSNVIKKHVDQLIADEKLIKETTPVKKRGRPTIRYYVK